MTDPNIKPKPPHGKTAGWIKLGDIAAGVSAEMRARMAAAHEEECESLRHASSSRAVREPATGHNQMGWAMKARLRRTSRAYTLNFVSPVHSPIRIAH